MQRYGILGGHADFKLSKDLASLQSTLNGRLTCFEDTCDTFREAQATYAALPVGNLPDDWLQTGDALHEQRIKLLQEELQILAELRTYYQTLDAERKIAAQKAEKLHEDTTAKIKAELIKLGYVDGLIPGGNRICIQPGFVQSHPDVFRTRNEAEALTRAKSTDLLQLYGDREDKILAELNEIRHRAMQTI